MNKSLLAFLILSAGAFSFATVHRAAQRSEAARAPREELWRTSTNAVAELNQTIAMLRQEVLDKKSRLMRASPHSSISPELLKLLEGDDSKASSAAWVELRKQLGIGWNSSDDYVLVSKRVLKQLQFQKLLSAQVVTDPSSSLSDLARGVR